MTTNPRQIHQLVKKKNGTCKEVDDGDIVCGLAIYAKGYCKKHYSKQYKQQPKGTCKEVGFDGNICGLPMQDVTTLYISSIIPRLRGRRFSLLTNSICVRLRNETKLQDKRIAHPRKLFLRNRPAVATRCFSPLTRLPAL